MTKKCTKCGEIKPLEEFYKHPQGTLGRDSKCKECCKKYSVSKYKQQKNDPEFILKQRARGREKYQRLYAGLSKNSPEVKRKIIETYKLKHPEKRKAHILVNNCLKRGVIKKAPCSVCGSLIVEAHHEDYSKPLDIIWLCDTHHKERHIELKRIELLNRQAS